MFWLAAVCGLVALVWLALVLEMHAPRRARKSKIAVVRDGWMDRRKHGATVEGRRRVEVDSGAGRS